MKKLLTIKNAAKSIGVSRSTIYNWERKKIFRPLKNHLGWRFFTVEMVNRLRALVVPK